MLRGYRSVVLIIIVAFVSSIELQAQLPVSVADRVDSIAAKALANTGTPSTSLAVVKDGKIAYVKAYGNARLDPATPARSDMRYAVGSVSKQFMACAILLLQQDGKLSLDDPVSRFLPSLTRAHDVTIRELLSHTSGYQDYYPLDYVAPFMLQPVTADGILDRWAKKPLDFDPGTRWQYSNTNYVVAGRIVEIVSGMPAFSFVEKRILHPLGMESAINLDAQPLSDSDAAGYTRFALGPVRQVQPEAKGWLFAAGELAMTAHDLALWDVSLLDGKLLAPSSLNEMITPARLKNGTTTNYGLGQGVADSADHPKLEHGGAVSGFVSDNVVWLGQGAAIAVFTNLDGSSAAHSIASQIGPLLLSEKQDPQAAQQLEQARRVFGELQDGKIDRSVLTSDADAYFTAQVLADAAASLKPLGAPQSFEQTSFGLRGGMTYRRFRLQFASGKSLAVSTFSVDDGKFAQYLIE
ncbi:MAG TPA: serine hydrolase domain-containing protein [Terriglobia bacterium]|nr:serine hydrolase domain-containing protein [Terriglobia bacterium]